MKEFPKKLHHKLVRVTWYDMVCSAGWMTNTANLEPYKIETVGWVSSITKTKELGEIITLSASNGPERDGTLDWNQHMTIPVVNITKVRSLE